MAFREVLVTQVREVLRAWLAGAGKRPAARRAGVDVKTAARYIAAARAAGLARDGDESQLTDELLGQVVAAVRPARPAGHGASWEALVPVTAEVTGWVKDGLTLVKIGELVERRRLIQGLNGSNLLSRLVALTSSLVTSGSRANRCTVPRSRPSVRLIAPRECPAVSSSRIVAWRSRVRDTSRSSRPHTSRRPSGSPGGAGCSPAGSCPGGIPPTSPGSGVSSLRQARCADVSGQTGRRSTGTSSFPTRSAARRSWFAQQQLPDTPGAGHGAPGLLEQPAARAALPACPTGSARRSCSAITRACLRARSPPRWASAPVRCTATLPAGCPPFVQLWNRPARTRPDPATATMPGQAMSNREFPG
jgi:hypothetical protein